MEMNDMVMISVDDHIVEPPDMFKHALPAQWQHKAPKLERIDGFDYWIFDGKRQWNFALNAVVGRPYEERGIEPDNFDQIRLGCYNPKARVDDMNANGVLASMNFPTFVGFHGHMFVKQGDRATNEILIQAYNDWHIDEWCGSQPGRFIPSAILPLWDPQAMVKEAKRAQAKGARAVNVPPIPGIHGLPSIHSEHWKPLFELANDTGLVLASHIGPGGGADPAGPESPIDTAFNKASLASMSLLVELLWSRIPRDYPKLRYLLAEGMIGWIPHILERAQFTYDVHSPWTHQDFGDKKIIEIFREHFFSCFIHDEVGLELRHRIGVDNITYETDYPHGDGLWPAAPEFTWNQLQATHCTDEEIDKMMFKNAIRCLDFDAVEMLGGRENCTVGALREKAKHVDTRIVAKRGGRSAMVGPGEIVTCGGLAAMNPAE